MLKFYRKMKTSYIWGDYYLNDQELIKVRDLSEKETKKRPLRSEVINLLLESLEKQDLKYLEIGVRNPADNFNLINVENKYSVDPGVEFKENPVDFKITSDEFFIQLRTGKILSKDIKFDVIFIDGLHLADQAERDINNALDFITDEGFIVVHDCNPPTEWHTRYNLKYELTPAGIYWNGTTWKAFVSFRQRDDYYSCCIDTDWGVGVIHKHINFGAKNNVSNEYLEFNIFDENRKNSLNLISFEKFREILLDKNLT